VSTRGAGGVPTGGPVESRQSRLSPALPLGPVHALLFALAFGCSLAGNWISQITGPTTTHQEVAVKATKTKRVSRLSLNAAASFLATVADGAVGLATSG